jgi:hypothetical protein
MRKPYITPTGKMLYRLGSSWKKRGDKNGSGKQMTQTQGS